MYVEGMKTLQTKHMIELQEVKKLIAKDEQAWERITQKYGTRLYSFLLRFSSHSYEVEDLYQEVWLRVYEKFDQYDPSQPFLPWLFRVAFRVALNFRRKLWPFTAITRDVAYQQQNLCEWREEIHNRLAILSPKRRWIFLLYHYESYSVREIAEIVQIPIASVKSDLRRGLQKLKGNL